MPDIYEIFKLANLTAMAGWLLLLTSPWLPVLTDRICAYVIPLILSIAYTSLLLVHWGQAEGGFDSLENVMLLFQSPAVMLIGWIHYLAFDLFVGAWEARTARAEHIPFLLVIPCLALTFMVGPVGFLLFMVLRAVFTLKNRSAAEVRANG